MPFPYKVGLQKKDPSPFYNPEVQRQQQFQDFYNMNREALNQDFVPSDQKQYDWLNRAGNAASVAAQLNMQSAMNATQNAINAGQSQPTPNLNGGAANPRLRAVLRALGAQESGNNYGAINSDSGALGRWQVMPSNLEGAGGWDMEALGKNITTDEFLSNKKLQNAIVRYKFKNYLDQYGLKGALSAWYSGDPNLWNNKDPQGNYPSIHAYVMEILKRLGLS